MNSSNPRYHEKLLALKRLSGVLFAIIFAWQFSRQILYPALHVPDSAPLILRPILGFLAAWFFVKKAGENWQIYGLRRPDSMIKLIAWTASLYGLMWLSSTYVSEPLANWLGFQPKPSFIVYVHNNTVAFIGWLGISWVIGGFVEELLFRAYIFTQISKLFSTPWIGISIGLVSQAALFGLLHIYQGLFGFVYAGITAIIMGLVYIMNGRNLWPLIIAHALLDSVSIAEIYWG